MSFEHYITFAIVCICVTALGLFAVVKACDWLIGLKYKSIADCSRTRHDWAECLKADFASKETVSNLKDDFEEMKGKIDDIHDVIMTFAVKKIKEDKE